MEKISSNDSAQSFFTHVNSFCLLMAIFVMLVHNSTGASVVNDGSSIYAFVSWFHRSFLNKGVAVCAVPTFFMISGLLFFRNYNPHVYAEKLRCRFKSLFIPFVAWNSIGMLLAVLIGLPIIRDLIVSREVFEFKFENFVEGIFLYKYNGPFWYVFDLIVFVIASPLIFEILKRKVVGLFFLGMFLLLYLMEIKLPDSIIYRSDVLFYYIAGAYLGIHYSLFIMRKISPKFAYISLFVGLPLCCAFFYYDICGSSCYSFNVFGILLCLVYGGFFWCAFHLVPLRFMRCNAILPFFIYASHIHVCGAFTKFLPRLSIFDAGTTYALTLVFSTILTLLSCIFIIKIMKIHFPIILNIFSGER